MEESYVVSGGRWQRNPSTVLKCGLLMAKWRCGRFGDAPSSTKRALPQPRTVREHGKCARSHNWCACAPLWLAAQRHWVFCYLPGIELHPVFVVYGYSHRTVQTSSEPKPGAMAQVLRYRVPAEWPFCWREPQHRTWRTLGMSQSNPSAALALYSLLGPRATVASVQSGRSDAIVTRGTVPQQNGHSAGRYERHGRRSTVPGVPWACPSRALVVFTLLGIRAAVATAASVHPPTALPAAAHVTESHTCRTPIYVL